MNIIKKEDLLLPKLKVLQEHAVVFFYWKKKKQRLWKALLLTLPLLVPLYDIHCICTAQREHGYSCVAPSFPSLSVPCIDLLLVVPYSSIHTVIYVCSCWSPFLIMGLSDRYGQCFNATLQRKKKKSNIQETHPYSALLPQQLAEGTASTALLKLQGSLHSKTLASLR